MRFNLGEGLAKKEENFAEEIAKATGGQWGAVLYDKSDEFCNFLIRQGRLALCLLNVLMKSRSCFLSGVVGLFLQQASGDLQLYSLALWDYIA